MGIGLIFIGCCFLFNPVISLVDVLPDFFGMILILRGMSKIADLNNHIGESYLKMKAAMWVSLGKLVALFLAGAVDSTMRLTLALAIGVLDCVFLIPAFVEFTEGISYLAIRETNNHQYEEGNLKILSVSFVVARAVSTVVPDFIVMMLKTSGGKVTSGHNNYSSVGPVLTAAFVLVTLVVGIVWLMSLKKTISSVTSDKELISRLEYRYRTEILENDEIMTRRCVKSFTTLMLCAFIPYITFKISIPIGLREVMLYIMPEFAFGIVTLFALKQAGSYAKDKRVPRAAVAFIAVSILQCAALVVYNYKFHGYYSAWKMGGFWAIFVPTALLTVLSFILFAYCACGMTRVLRKMIDSCVGLRGMYNDDRRRDIDNARKKQLKRRVTLLDIFIYVYMIASVTSMLLMPLSEALWLIRFLLGIALFVSVYCITREISDEAENAI